MNRICSRIAVEAMAFACFCSAVFLAPPAGAGQEGGSFVETFDKLNRSRWFLSDGWTNGDHQNCTWSKDQVKVRDGVLRLGFASNEGGRPAVGKVEEKNVRPFSCGEIQTKASFGYGTYEVRLRTPAGSGLNANMFSFIGPAQKQPHDEIDFEFLLKDTSRVQVNSYVSGKGGNEHLVPLKTASDAEFADYAFVWEAKRLRWFVNGTQVYEITDPAKIPSHESKIYLSLWGSDTMAGWLGRFRPPATGLTMEVDRVAFTALHQPCQFEHSVACLRSVANIPQ